MLIMNGIVSANDYPPRCPEAVWRFKWSEARDESSNRGKTEQ